ncbi:MAG: hypothetical protein GY778_23730 [bacterium]|nr:hypothetical protein [bacterium]
MWPGFWHWWLLGTVVIGVGTAAVCFFGGIVDMVGFIKDLKTTADAPTDDASRQSGK